MGVEQEQEANCGVAEKGGKEGELSGSTVKWEKLPDKVDLLL